METTEKNYAELCYDAYHKAGDSIDAIIKYVNRHPNPEVYWTHCNGCETEYPAWQGECLICGSAVQPNYNTPWKIDNTVFNTGWINYSQFLFGQLLMIIHPKYKEMEYDLLFEVLPVMYKVFQNSCFNNSERSEYDCIIDYLKNTKL